MPSNSTYLFALALALVAALSVAAVPQRVNRYIQLAILLAWLALMMVGAYGPYWLNVDTYLHWSVSSLYMREPSAISWQDSFTVGWLVPALLAIWRMAYGAMGAATADQVSLISISLQFSIICAITLACAWAVSRGTSTVVRERDRLHFVWLAVACCALTGTLDLMMFDVYSYNAEAFAVLVITLALVAGGRPLTRRNLLIRALLVALVPYVKLQAAPIAAYALLLRHRRRGSWPVWMNERWLLPALSAACFLAIETLLALTGGGGVLPKLGALLDYIRFSGTPVEHPRANGALSAKLLDYAQWLVHSSYSLAPVQAVSLVVVPLGLATLRLRRGTRLWALHFIAMAAISVACMVIAGRKYTHYILLLMATHYGLFMLLRSAVLHPPLRSMLYGRGAGAATLAVFATVLTVTALDASRNLMSEKSDAHTGRLIEGKDSLLATMSQASGSVLVHGWDHRLYAYSGTYPRTRLSLDQLYAQGKRGPEFMCQYAREVATVRPDLIVDAVSAGMGMIRAPEFRLAPNTVLGELFGLSYLSAGPISGVNTWRSRPEGSLHAMACDLRPAPLSLTGAMLACEGCAPPAHLFDEPVRDRRIIGTWHGGDESAGHAEVAITISSRDRLVILPWIKGPGVWAYGISWTQTCASVRLPEQQVDTTYMHDAPYHRWRHIAIRMAQPCDGEVLVKIEDRGSQYGQWLGVSDAVLMR